MKKLNFEAPINPLSLGNVAVNFLRELRLKDLDLSFFPIGENGDFSAYDKTQEDFKEWISSVAAQRLTKLDKDVPTLKVWHINGSEKTLGQNQYLYTFYEVDSPTKEEINIVKMQKHVFFSSSDACDAFKSAGCDNVSHVPLGFDPDFCKTDKEYMDDVTHFGLVGKFERRKNTSLIIQSWLKRFGNNPKYQLTCLVNNPFFAKETMDEMLQYSLMNQSWSNINFLPHLTTNSEVNELTNSIDIDLSGLSNGEGWNLPAFNATALGKWSIVSNCSSHKDWAKKDNCILVEPEHKQPCYDNIFFHEGLLFNQGSYYKISEEKIFSAFETAVVMAKQPNKEGEKLKSEFTYEKSIDKILSVIFQ